MKKSQNLKLAVTLGLMLNILGFVLELDYGFQLVLDNVFCVPSFRRNLISL